MEVNRRQMVCAVQLRLSMSVPKLCLMYKNGVSMVLAALTSLPRTTVCVKMFLTFSSNYQILK